MKLLNAHTWEIRDFISDEDVPPYAILSHTWATEEITFHDWQNLPSTEISAKHGYQKIRFCCQQAVEDNLEWAWIDTCCIDKSSSAELEEAIYSMFRWYQNAVICYVYLVDVSVNIDQSETYNNFARSRWFTRGWTLQELLAPTNITFYSTDWKSLGKKSELLNIISLITGIEEEFLQDRELQYASISKRMSWAAKRNTSRAEDMAYCLLGIFDINMPFIYGEGKKAFQRLQLEIMKDYPYDHTLYAWGVLVEKSSCMLPITGELPPWNQSNSRRRLLGPFAESPHDFEFSGSFSPSPLVRKFYQDPKRVQPRLPTLVGSAIQFELPTVGSASVYHWSQLRITQVRNLIVVILFCVATKNTTSYIGIHLQPSSHRCWGRTSEITLHDMPSLLTTNIGPSMVHVEAEKPMILENGDVVFRRLECSSDINLPQMVTYQYTRWNSGVNALSNTLHEEPFAFSFRFKNTDESLISGFKIRFNRLPNKSLFAGQLSVMFVLTKDNVGGGDIWIDNNGLVTISDQFSMATLIEIESFLGVSESKYYHIMEPLVDSWILDTEYFPKISVKVERLSINSKREVGVVDVVDLVVASRDMTHITYI